MSFKCQSCWTCSYLCLECNPFHSLTGILLFISTYFISLFSRQRNLHFSIFFHCTLQIIVIVLISWLYISNSTLMCLELYKCRTLCFVNNDHTIYQLCACYGARIISGTTELPIVCCWINGKTGKIKISFVWTMIAKETVWK